MKKAIFTCLFGNYDTLNKAPKFKGWDSILFTDSKPTDSKGWKVIIVESKNSFLDSRRFKFLSHIHLSEYDLVCYQDANIILKKAPTENPLWCRHPRRKSITDECKRLTELGKITKTEIGNLFRFFNQNKFKDNAGLYQNGFFVRNHSEKMNKLMELTFELISSFNCRDQLAFPYATWKLGYRPDGTINYNLKDSEIEFIPHLNQKVENKIQVHHITPARSDKNLGKAVNQAIEGLPDQDWICLRDIDTLPIYHEAFIKQVEEIANNPQGYVLIGCMTNRLGLKYQLVPAMFDEWDIKKHRAKAKELATKPGIKKLNGLQTVAGLMMLFPKSVWKQVGKFPEGGIEIKGQFVDYHFSKAVAKIGKLGIAEHIYLFHSYRMDAKDTRTAKDHLK